LRRLPEYYTTSMSITAIKDEIAHMTPEERRHLAAYIVSLNSRLEPEFRQKLAEKIDDNSPERWVSLEDVERMFPND
jgi:hypothetical protein